MYAYDPNGYELWRERRAELLRERERYRFAHRLRTAPRVAPRMSGKAA
jgi:hypothetical protein